MSHRARPLYTIDLLRIASALSVAAFHFGTLASRREDDRFAGFIQRGLLPDGNGFGTWSGWVGVEVFFVISGYVIAASAIGSSASDFAWRRVARLVPGVWICATITLFALMTVAHGARPIVFRDWISSVSFVPFTYGIDPSYWTLGVEVGFYLLIALAGVRTVESLWRVAIGLGVAGSVAALGYLYGVDYYAGPVGEFALATYGGFFALGIVLYLIASQGARPPLVTAAMALTFPCTIEIISRTRELHSISASPMLPLALFWCGVILIAGAQRLQGWLPRERSAPLLGLLGRATYPFYLLHQTAGLILVGWLLVGGVSGPTAIFVSLVVVIAVALVVTRFLEPAVRARLVQLRRVTTRHAPAPDSPATASPSVG